mgnify:CR=1 FL=1
MSPNDALDFLKPEVPTFAILLLVIDSSVVAALRPVSDVSVSYTHLTLPTNREV